MGRKHPIRSSQIVTQYGVGSMVVGRNGESLIVAGLDSWFPAAGKAAGGPEGDGELFDESEFVIREPRLEKRLRVKSFRMPPEYREARRGRTTPNTNLTISVLRFPQWHMCSRCGQMRFLPLTQTGKVFCSLCQEEDFCSVLAQIPFIAICEKGHIQDFPWREWVHRQHQPTCSGNLYYLPSGGATPAAQKVKCNCGKVRSLLGIDKASFSATHLSFHLSQSEGMYFCRGQRPWLAETADVGCDSYLRGNLRNAGNVWFSQTISAICLPEENTEPEQKLREFLGEPDVEAKVHSLEGLNEKDVVQVLKAFYAEFMSGFDDGQIGNAVKSITGGNRFVESKGQSGIPLTVSSAPSNPEPKEREESETEFRHAEFLALREEHDTDTLLSRRIHLGHNSSLLSSSFSRLVQIHRLRETRAFTGFSRVFSDNAPTLEDRKSMLRRNSRETEQSGSLKLEGNPQLTDWLPAATVYGEGIYLEFREDRLEAWEHSYRDLLRRHLAPLDLATSRKRRSESMQGNDSGREASVIERISPRFLLVHTLAHVLINQMIFDSGYSAAALRERIYVSESKQTRMAGLLIYTADGDSAGTLGGLVRLGSPDNLEKLLSRALRGAGWCSSDPGCSEIGTTQGQGPENRNLAACHTCAHLPETSCEEFNGFLDRAVLVNLTGAPPLGFFDFV